VGEGSPAWLEQAAVLYRGDLRDGFQVKSAIFEDWLVTERERLRELARQRDDRRGGARACARL
jgi:hypothetical protein